MAMLLLNTQLKYLLRYIICPKAASSYIPFVPTHGASSHRLQTPKEMMSKSPVTVSNLGTRYTYQALA